MALVFDDDALPHAKGPGNDWRESFYCNFFDVKSNLCGLFWQGVRPNSGHGEAVFLLFDGDTDLVRSVDLKLQVASDVPADRRKIGHAEFTCIEPWKHWTVRYEKGDDWFELDWKQMSDVCDWEWEDLTNSKHFQLAGKVVGRGVAGGREINFEGYGERDRAWGDRNYGPLKVSFWNVLQFPDDVAIHAFVLLQSDGTYRLHGYIHKDGVTHGLAKFDAEITYNGPKGPPENGSIRYEDDAGRVIEVSSFQRKNHLAMGTSQEDGAQLNVDSTDSTSLMFLTFQRFVRSDGMLGHGMIDYNCQVGNQPSSIHAEAPPLYSTLYTYGRK
ncbi:hypothetical protein C4E44_20095 [Pseudomonas sp. MWU12-2312b]|uniref:DUF7065 domain-containing protein n=1 Tax=Pseudomonas moorei TaxID=395599 RepID=UPI000D4F2C74|nr:hypothetical protein [Pseudomonas moorei]PPA02312.1 hypothetical protein C4E44_20095 [Pseudomonas sp. MWU12-2312b]